MVAAIRRRRVQLLNAANQEDTAPWRREAPSRKQERVCVIVTARSDGSSKRVGGFLTKRAAKSAMDLSETGVRRAAKAAERQYVPFEEDPTASGTAAEDALETPSAGPAKPSMREVFGPDGFLEKCMKGGFD